MTNERHGVWIDEWIIEFNRRVLDVIGLPVSGIRSATITIEVGKPPVINVTYSPVPRKSATNGDVAKDLQT